MFNVNFLRISVPILCTAVMMSCSHSQSEDSFNVDDAIAQCHQQVLRSLSQLSAEGYIDTSQMPRNVAKGDSTWTLKPLCAAEWCSGFWPGILWLDYSSNPSGTVRQAALDATKAMQRIVEDPLLDHDLGFLIYCSAGTGLRVLEKELQDSSLSAQQRSEDMEVCHFYREMCLRAADSLARLYNPRVGTILSWPRNVAVFGGHNTIMDNMINLELLCWAANELESDSVKSAYLRDIAIKHAETTLKHHFRDDNTSYHVAVYDTLDGHFIHGVTHQGLSDSSTWARGQAWAVYGFTMMARETGSRQFLEKACGAADAFLSRLPADYVPYWDFDDPRIATSPEHPAEPSATVAPRDASAAAVVASALIELSSLLNHSGATSSSDGQKYLAMAKKMLASLASPYYQAGRDNPAFLLHSTGNHPAGKEIDIPIVYADYYYLEALIRLKTLCQ